MTASRSSISPSYNGSHGCHHNPKTCGSLGGNLGVASKDCEDVTEREGRRMEAMCEHRKAGGRMVHLGASAGRPGYAGCELRKVAGIYQNYL